MSVLLSPATCGLPALYWDRSPNFTFGRGSIKKPTAIVWHDCEGSAAGSIAWFDVLKSSVSAHFVLSEDGTKITQQVALADKAWACCFYNSQTVNLEMGGFEAKGFAEAEWESAARVIAYLCYLLGITPKAVKPNAFGLLPSGVCRHYDLGKLGGSHTDPSTDDLKWAWAMGLVAKQYALGGWPAATWAR